MEVQEWPPGLKDIENQIHNTPKVKITELEVDGDPFGVFLRLVVWPKLKEA